MPKDTMDNLNKAKENKVKANPKDIDALKLAIAKKLKAQYVSHKEVYPGLQKYPGRKIYEKVTSQVRLNRKPWIIAIAQLKYVRKSFFSFFRLKLSLEIL